MHMKPIGKTFLKKKNGCSGTYSGQIVLWDTRAKQLPVQRTPLSTSGHTHPVYCMAMVGLANNHSLVTASSDGKICFWNLSQLSEPVDVIDIQVMPQEDQGGMCESLYVYTFIHVNDLEREGGKVVLIN